MTYRGRFAPSPTGPLHFGSLVAALGSWLCARACGGVWIVRMEDLDPPREVPGAAADILATLAAFGMQSDEPVLYQSARRDAYGAAFDALRAVDQVFPCWCSRSELEADANIHRACRAVAAHDRAPAWRLRVPNLVIEFEDLLLGVQRQNLRDEVGDFVVKRVEGWYAYQLAVVVDDAEQDITEIVRGADLLDSTPRQIHLQRLLGLATPGYAHLPLVLDADGRKLSKQDRARPIERTDPLPALHAALRFLGLDEQRGTSNVQQLLQASLRDFDLARIKKNAAPGANPVRDAS